MQISVRTGVDCVQVKKREKKIDNAIKETKNERDRILNDKSN